MRLFGSIKELVSAVFRKDTYEVTLKPNSNTYTGATEFQLPPKTNGNGVLVASGDIVNADIAAGAAIVDTKLATISTAGKVSNSATTATSSNTASAIVARDSSGNFSAGTITASLSGNVTGNVSGSAASFTGSLSGEVTGTQSATVVADDVIDNANIKSTAAIAYSKLNLSSSIVNADISNSAGIVDTKLATISTAGKVANSATTATSSAANSTIVARDAAGATNLTGLGVSGNLTTNNLEATGQSLLQFAYINGTAGMGFVEMEGQSTSAVAAPTVGEARLFSGTDGKIYVRKKGSSAAEELGASGSGEVNLVDTPSDAGSWVGVNATVTTNTTAANNPLAGVIDSSISIASSTLNGYARTRFTMPSALKNRKLKLEWFQIAASLSSGAYKVEVYTNASSDYSGAYTELALSTDSSGTSSIPNLNGKYSTTFDTNGSDYYEIRVVRTATSAATIYIANVVCGPGIQPQGAVVGEAVSYTPTWTNLTLGNGTTSGLYRRVGSFMEVEATLTWGTTTSLSGTLGIDLPSTAFNLGSIPGVGQAVGTARIRDAGVMTYTGVVTVNVTSGSANIASIALYNNNSAVSNTVPFTFGSADTVSINFMVPIAEWAGSGTVQLAQNDVEYAASTSGTWDAAASTAQTVYGPGGAPISGSLTTNRTKVVRFQTPIQVGDLVVLEFKNPSGVWCQASNTLYAFSYQKNASFGARITETVVGSTDVEVTFNQYGAPGSTYGTADATAINWSTAFATAWRVRKASAGAAVGFGIVQPGVSAGLVSASGLPGNTTGNAIASGYVGEVKAGTSDAPTSSPGSNSDKTVTTLALTKGVWLVTGQVLYDPFGLTVTRMQASISTGTTAQSGTIYNVFGVDFVDASAGTTGGYVIAYFNFTANIGADATYNVNARPFYTGTPIATPLRAVIRAVRIA